MTNQIRWHCLSCGLSGFGEEARATQDALTHTATHTQMPAHAHTEAREATAEGVGGVATFREG